MKHQQAYINSTNVDIRYKGKHNSRNQETHTRKRTYRKLQHAHMHVFDVIK